MNKTIRDMVKKIQAQLILSHQGLDYPYGCSSAYDLDDLYYRLFLEVEKALIGDDE